MGDTWEVKLKKKAVIVVGSHNAGKSKTINQHLKPMLDIGEKVHIFHRNGKEGLILSQSFEEADRDIDERIKKYGHYDILVLAARPINETPSFLREWAEKLKANGYLVGEVRVECSDSEKYYQNKAKEVLAVIDK